MAESKLRLVGGRETRSGNVASPEPYIDREVYDHLAGMLDAAKAGEVIGIAYAVIYRGRHFIVEVAGELRRNPTFARGCVAALDDDLSRMAWGDT